MAGGIGLLRSLGFQGMTGIVTAASKGSAANNPTNRFDTTTSMRRTFFRTNRE
jgi:hypothetical protein